LKRKLHIKDWSPELNTSVYEQVGLYNKALEFQLKTLKIADNLKNTQYIINSNINLSNLYRAKGDDKNAINYYNNVYKLATQIDDTLSNYRYTKLIQIYTFVVCFLLHRVSNNMYYLFLLTLHRHRPYISLRQNY
jgi:tetratricopeptide (TPR) repeat protein